MSNDDAVQAWPQEDGVRDPDDHGPGCGCVGCYLTYPAPVSSPAGEDVEAGFAGDEVERAWEAWERPARFSHATLGSEREAFVAGAKFAALSARPVEAGEVERLREARDRWRAIAIDYEGKRDAARQEVADLRVEVERHALANGGCVPGDAYRDLAREHAAAEERLDKVRALADGWRADGPTDTEPGLAIFLDRLRALLDGDSEGRESGQPVAQEGEEEWGVGHGTHFEQAADRRDAEEWIEDDDSWNPGERRWLVRRTVTPWVPVETGGEGR